jgi:hypothetical protein
MDTQEFEPDRWRRFARERIEGFRRGSVDFDGLLLSFSVFATMVEAGTANPRASVRTALLDFMIAAAAFDRAGRPGPAALEPQLQALLDAINGGAH